MIGYDFAPTPKARGDDLTACFYADNCGKDKTAECSLTPES